MSETTELPESKRGLVVRLLRSFLYAVVVLVVLVFLLAALPGFEVVIEFAFHLVAGWFLYLREVTGQVTVNSGLIASSLFTLSVAVLGLHALAGWLWRRSRPDEGPWVFRWTAAVTTMLLLLFASANAGAGIGHQIGWLKSMRWVDGYRWGSLAFGPQGSTAQRFINSWAEDHNDHYPLTLGEAMVQVDEPQMFLLVSWPAGSTPEPWLYFGPLHGKRVTESLPLLASPRSYQGKRVVVFTDSGSMLMDEDKFQSQLAQMRAKAK